MDLPQFLLFSCGIEDVKRRRSGPSCAFILLFGIWLSVQVAFNDQLLRVTVKLRSDPMGPLYEQKDVVARWRCLLQLRNKLGKDG